MTQAGPRVTPALLRLVEDRSVAVVSVALAALVIVLGAVDVVTGWEMSFSIFYLIPVALGSWRGGKRAAVVLSLVCAVAWFFADRLAGHVYSREWIAYWNSTVRFGLFLASGLTLAALRGTLIRANALARTDALTGLANVRAFHEELAYHVELAQRHNDAMTIATIDLDNFKAVNDRWGHEAGDRALRLVARVLGDRLRTVDVIARIGGDEFVVLLPRTPDAAALRVLEEVRAGVEAEMARQSWPVTASIGAVSANGRVSPPDLLRASDAALYEAKAAGRNAVRSARLSVPAGAAALPAIAELRRNRHISPSGAENRSNLQRHTESTSE